MRQILVDNARTGKVLEMQVFGGMSVEDAALAPRGFRTHDQTRYEAGASLAATRTRHAALISREDLNDKAELAKDRDCCRTLFLPAGAGRGQSDQLRPQKPRIANMRAQLFFENTGKFSPDVWLYGTGCHPVEPNARIIGQRGSLRKTINMALR